LPGAKFALVSGHAQERVMIIFNVVKERCGWTVRTGKCMTTPFWSRDSAIREAHCLAETLRRHGEYAEVIVEDAEPDQPLSRTRNSSRPGPDLFPQGRRRGPQ
jgi:hypothetical protein